MIALWFVIQIKAQIETDPVEREARDVLSKAAGQYKAALEKVEQRVGDESQLATESEW